jgi:hypothetical protein
MHLVPVIMYAMNTVTEVIQDVITQVRKQNGWSQADLDAGLRRFLLAIGATVVIDALPPRAGRKRQRPTVTIRYGEPYARIICP